MSLLSDLWGFLFGSNKKNAEKSGTPCSEAQKDICVSRFKKELARRFENGVSDPLEENEFCLSSCSRRSTSGGI